MIELVGMLLGRTVLAQVILAATGLFAVFGALPIEAATKRFGGVWLALFAMFL
jgi:hypothetical protein